MIKSAIFDVDGTLLDSMKIWDDAGERYLSSVGKTAENGLSEKLCDMSLTEGAEYMKKQYAPSFSTDEIVSGVLKIIEDFYFYEVGLKNGTKEILQFLESNNIKMIIGLKSSKELQGEGDIRSITIPERKIVSCLHRGTYSELAVLYNEMMEWIKTNGYKLSGTSIEYYYSNPNVPEEEQVTRIEMPLL